MRHAPVIQGGRKRVINSRHDVAVQCDIVNARLGDRVLSQAVGRVGAKAVLEGRDVIIRHCGCISCQHCRRGYAVHDIPPKALSDEFVRVVSIL